MSNVSKKVLSVLIVLIVLGCVCIVAVNLRDTNRPNEITDVNGQIHEVSDEVVVTSMVSECTDVVDFSVITNYVSVSNVPEGSYELYWEIPEGIELSLVDSNKGQLPYVLCENGVVISMEGGSDTQLVLYMKVYDLDSALNGIIRSNEAVTIAKDFYYNVVLPDGVVVEFSRYTDDTKVITLGEYFDLAKVSR